MKTTWNTFVCVLFCSISFSNNVTANDCNLEIDAIIPINCNNTSKGEIKIQVSGGNAPYYYKIDNETFLESNIISGLSSGNYDITIKDSSGCKVTLYTYIEIPEPITISYELKHNRLIVSTDKIGDYKYKLNDENWTNSPVFEDVTELNSITIKTQHGCEISKIINEVNTAEVFKFHPNPANDNVFVMGTHDIKTIDILNAYGKLVLSHQVNKSVVKLNVSDLKSGIYLIQVVDVNNRRQVKKLIVN
jgi:hypothetical protein